MITEVISSANLRETAIIIVNAYEDKLLAMVYSQWVAQNFMAKDEITKAQCIVQWLELKNFELDKLK